MDFTPDCNGVVMLLEHLETSMYLILSFLFSFSLSHISALDFVQCRLTDLKMKSDLPKNLQSF